MLSMCNTYSTHCVLMYSVYYTLCSNEYVIMSIAPSGMTKLLQHDGLKVNKYRQAAAFAHIYPIR